MTAKSAGKSPAKVDVAVVGAGPSGMACAILFARQGFSTALIAPSGPSEDGRTTALLDSSVEMLKNLGLWDAIRPHAAPLSHMRIIDATERLIRAPEIVFDASELKLEAFGYNVENKDLNAILAKACKGEKDLQRFNALADTLTIGAQSVSISLDNGVIVEAALTIGADGRRSKVRDAAGIEVSEWRYPQSALVLNLEHHVPHYNHSTEFHTRSDPFTLVPLPGRRSSLVCVVDPDTAETLKRLPDEELALEIERRAQSAYGAMKVAGSRQCYPLGGLSAKTVARNRCALVGEAAHVFPPIGAQGLNLGLRDVAALGEIVANARQQGIDIGSGEVLSRYERARRPDILSRTTGVDLLNRSLLTDLLPVQLARSAGLYLAGKVGPLRRLLMREGIAPMFSRPRLMKGFSLPRAS
ncbi:UbiH/UbiF family hydroxylase [Stappia sp. GBMRC 2046]|uniref:UbiH/UbiF family hydroxylase n=1 Tax=Stappia sediminis TaxID=2692190 RepID=A0A7X3LT45_9HYPH|nr:UbiH/UbiF family hydroxylase [Stappia sediminis]MXN64612.1 UbiH/UbiF family hydroxylase [Stappia sediminis]